MAPSTDFVACHGTLYTPQRSAPLQTFFLVCSLSSLFFPHRTTPPGGMDRVNPEERRECVGGEGADVAADPRVPRAAGCLSRGCLLGGEEG